MSELERFGPNFRRYGLFEWHQALMQKLDVIETVLGGVPGGLIDDPTGASRNVKAPPPADFNVVGIDGKFVTTVNNPQTIQPQSMALARARFLAGMNLAYTPLLHNLQSATDLNFNQNSSLKDYGISTQLMWTDQDPNVTRFFRLRSSYDGTNWNGWQIFSSPITCGPVGVASGTLRSIALSTLNAGGTPTTQPLTSVTGVPVNAATINIASFVVQYAAPIGAKTYNSGSITPLLDATTYYVYCLDPSYAGGTQTYIASQSNPDVTSNDGIVFLGKITTPAHGGGGTGGSGGGNGPCFTGNTLLITKTGIKPIRDVVGQNDEILTQRGWRRVRCLIEHAYDGPVCRMGNGECVTPEHRFWMGGGGDYEAGWYPAKNIFPGHPRTFTGSVFNLSIDGDGSDDEQCYTLANGWIAHNVVKA